MRVHYYKYLILTIIIFCISLSNKIYSQNSENEQVKRLQRSIYIFNFAQQVNWLDNNNQDVFTIGVLGPDRTSLDLNSLAQNRKITNKKVIVVRFNAVKDIKNVQLLYVNNKFNFDVDYILNKIAGKNILLVSEDFDFNSSMINIVNVKNSFEYQINETLLNQEGFTFLSTLKKHAITSENKWKKLFQSSEKELNKIIEDKTEKEQIIQQKEKEIEKQQSEIYKKENEIESIEKNIKAQDQTIEELYDINTLQQKKYKDKVEIERALEDKIKQQIDAIKIQRDTIKESNFEIIKQKIYLAKQNKEIQEKEVVLKTKNSELYVQKTVNYLLAGLFGLSLLGGLIIYRNYKSKKKLNKKLEEKNQNINEQSLLLESNNKELEQFAYITSHDLKEPLTTISGLIYLFLDDNKDKLDEDSKTTLEFINESSIRMTNLIDSLLEHSRLGKEKNHSTIDCDKIITELQADLGNIISRTNAEIIINPLPTIKGNELEIRLVFQNLINNALKFSKPNIDPLVIVTCEKISSEENTSTFWQFSVQDNGIGIADRHKDKVFAIFQRLHSREEYEGSGIGLAHCKKIVESHGGKIWLESTEGEGTTFYFTIAA